MSAASFGLTDVALGASGLVAEVRPMSHEPVRPILLAVAAVLAEAVLLPSPVILSVIGAPYAVWVAATVVFLLATPLLAAGAIGLGRADAQADAPRTSASPGAAMRIGTGMLLFHCILIISGMLMLTQLHRLLFQVNQALGLE
jgi:hypothetical protein